MGCRMMEWDGKGWIPRPWDAVGSNFLLAAVAVRWVRRAMVSHPTRQVTTRDTLVFSNQAIKTENCGGPGAVVVDNKIDKQCPV